MIRAEHLLSQLLLLFYIAAELVQAESVQEFLQLYPKQQLLHLEILAADSTCKLCELDQVHLEDLLGLCKLVQLVQGFYK